MTRTTKRNDFNRKLLEKDSKRTGARKYAHWAWVFFENLFKIGLVAGFIGMLGGAVYVTNVLNETPIITEDLIKSATAETTNMYASDGTLIYSDFDNQRNYITIDKTPELYKKILLATENAEFYQEDGYSLKGIANAVKSYITDRDNARGGSTIEQQLIKNLVFSSDVKDRTINRKIKELWLAIQMDKNFSKDQILEWYINMIYQGEGSYGANTVAITYFGQSLADLNDDSPETISKLAIIAGLGQSPSSYNLYDNPTEVTKRRNIVLREALERGIISESQYNQAKEIDVQTGLKERYWRNSEVLAEMTEHSAFITSALNQVRTLGYDLEKTHMQIHTTLDRNVDSQMKSIADNFTGYQDENMQAAFTIIDPTTGNVLSQYGGRYTEAMGLNRAIQNTRSSGSSTKPFIGYGPAIEYFGYGSGSIWDSSNYVYPGTSIVARNYGGYTYGNVTMHNALKLSLNTPVNRILDGVTGSDLTKRFLGGLNMDVKDSYGGADALGIDVSTEQLAGAFATLSNYGVYKTPKFVSKLVFNDGSEKNVTFAENQVMKESTAWLLTRMLQEVPTSGGTAKNAILPYAGHMAKTGTVGYDDSYGFPDYSSSDIWIGGSTKSASIALWMGYDEPLAPGNQISKDNSDNHEFLYAQLMRALNEGKDTSAWNQPNTVAGGSLDSYVPTDTSATVNKYEVPALSKVNDSIINKLSKSVSTKVTDEGMDKYSTPSDYDSVINWQNGTDEGMYSLYSNFAGDYMRAIYQQYNIYSN